MTESLLFELKDKWSAQIPHSCLLINSYQWLWHRNISCCLMQTTKYTYSMLLRSATLNPCSMNDFGNFGPTFIMLSWSGKVWTSIENKHQGIASSTSPVGWRDISIYITYCVTMCLTIDLGTESCVWNWELCFGAESCVLKMCSGAVFWNWKLFLELNWELCFGIESCVLELNRELCFGIESCVLRVESCVFLNGKLVFAEIHVQVWGCFHIRVWGNLFDWFIKI